MGNKKIKGIPYGLSDYGMIRKGYDYYVDKTRYLTEIEKSGRYLFFIRPRRFGKSLFLSMMHYYYDVNYKDRFEELFKGTWIHNHPTEERNSYLVLSLNFSSVDPAKELVERSFMELIRKRAFLFVDKYTKHLGTHRDYFIKEIEDARSPSDIMTAVLSLCEQAGQKIYIIIDEYDNLANTLLTVSGEQAYRDLTHGDGFFRSFFNILKAGTGDAGSPVSRLFITGVSPVTMDDVTSGFNIGQHVSRDANLNRMLGFTADDVTEMIEYYRENGKITHTTAELMDIMTKWYGNYRFSGEGDVLLFNSDMVLYFLINYMKRQKPPENLIDRNVRIDYRKLRHLIVIDQDKNKPPTTNGNFSRLKQIMEEGGILSKISDGFPLEEMADTNNFESLLYYFGLLTVAGQEMDRYRLEIPNETVKHIYCGYIEPLFAGRKVS